MNFTIAELEHTVNKAENSNSDQMDQMVMPWPWILNPIPREGEVGAIWAKEGKRPALSTALEAEMILEAWMALEADMALESGMDLEAGMAPEGETAVEDEVEDDTVDVVSRTAETVISFHRHLSFHQTIHTMGIDSNSSS